MKGQVIRQRELDARTRGAMYALFLRQFDEVTSAQFEADLAEKDWVLLLRRDDATLCGFSSIDLFDHVHEGREMSFVFSGDTVVDKDTWRDSALSYYWMAGVDYLARLHGKECLHWFLLVSGYRTYRFLPLYARTFYPRYDEQTPAGVQALMDGVASARYGERYDPETGIVRLAVPAILRDDFLGIPPHRLGDPHIAFFAQRNPGHERGDELVCFAKLSEDNLTPLGRRMWRKGRELFADAATA